MLVYFWLTLYFYASPSVIVNLLAKYRKLLLQSLSLFSSEIGGRFSKQLTDGTSWNLYFWLPWQIYTS